MSERYIDGGGNIPVRTYKTDVSNERGEALDRYIPDIVKNAMLTMWNYICDDTQCHPLDITHGKGKYLIFTPRHWAQLTGEMVSKNLRDLYSTTPLYFPDESARLIAAIIDEVAFDPISLNDSHPSWSCRREAAIEKANKIIDAFAAVRNFSGDRM